MAGVEGLYVYIFIKYYYTNEYLFTVQFLLFIFPQGFSFLTRRYGMVQFLIY